MAFKDLAGKRFGCLVALRTDGKRGRFIVWLCQCDCGETCSVLVNHLPNGHTRSCGCVRQRTNKKQLERRLLSLRQITESGCWEWLGSKARGGYGQAAYKKKVHKVHRLAAHVWSGFDLSSELMVCHKCDNPPCFNPEHLFSGTASDNVVDCVAKRRQRNIKKTHCPSGHEYSDANTYIDRVGNRHCRICKKEAFIRFHEKKALQPHAQ